MQETRNNCFGSKNVARPFFRRNQLSTVLIPKVLFNHIYSLDQGIIRAFKLHCRKFLLQAIISREEECKSENEIASRISILNAIMWVNDSCNLVCQSTISKCFERWKKMKSKKMVKFLKQNVNDVQKNENLCPK